MDLFIIRTFYRKILVYIKTNNTQINIFVVKAKMKVDFTKQLKAIHNQSVAAAENFKWGCWIYKIRK